MFDQIFNSNHIHYQNTLMFNKVDFLYPTYFGENGKLYNNNPISEGTQAFLLKMNLHNGV